MNNPLETYQKRFDYYLGKHKSLEKHATLVSNLRLVVSLGGIGLVFYLYFTVKHLSAAVFFIFAAALFTILVFRHQRLRKEQSFSQSMKKINEQSIARLSDSWTDFSDTGKEFIEESHPYIVDLDIFGKRSLFQLINTTNTFLGRLRLKDLLTNPPLEKYRVLINQEIIIELAEHLDFRQKLQCEGMQFSSTNKDPKELLSWAGLCHNQWTMPLIVSLMRLSPIALIILVILSLLMPEIIPYFIPLIYVLFHAILLFFFRKDTSTAFTVANKYQESVNCFKQMLKLFEEEDFRSPPLKEMQNALKKKNTVCAFRQIEKLRKAVDMTYIRYHQLYLIWNIFTLWDFQVMSALEGWKKESGSGLRKWLHSLGEIEALSSIALLAHDHPEWELPIFNNNCCMIKAKDLGHPLLPPSRVANNIEINNSGEILLITGSNMSGKSTFLRTVGMNLVLAYMGSPICAKDFQCSFLHIYTSMRINDNLDTGTSSFFAELVRIKNILAASKEGKPILFLLDEIFKGTNSRDRHTGAKHLIKKLSSTGAIGLVSTHDLELGDLSKESSYIKNYHFTEYYQNGNIYFDYKLKPGVSTTRNAIFLMKMAGIEIND